MDFFKNWQKKPWASYTIATCSAVLLYLVFCHLPQIWNALGRILKTLSPVLIGLIMAYVLDPMAHFFETRIFRKIRKDMVRRALAVALTIILVLLLITVLMVALIPQLISSIGGLITNFDSYTSTLQQLLYQLSSVAADHDVDISSATQATGNFFSLVRRLLPSSLEGIIHTSRNIGNTVFDYFISFILAIYFLLDSNRIRGFCRRLLVAVLPRKSFQSSLDFWRRCNKILIRYIGGDLLDGLVVGVANFIFMTICRMQYSVLISVVVGVTNLAPTFGPIVGFLSGAMILVLVNPWHALWFMIFTLILQTFDGYVFKPKLFGNSLGVASVWILICIIIGGRIFGVAGIMLAIPAAAISSFIVWDFMDGREKAAKTLSENKTP